MSQTQTNQLYIGWIDHYDPNRRFGFADVNVGQHRAERVFFHLDSQKVVAGTMTEPEITNRRCSIAPRYHRGMNEPPKIVLYMTEGPKGFKATAWGMLPERDWHHDLTVDRVLEQFTDQHLYIVYRVRPNSRHKLRGETGRLCGPVQLTPIVGRREVQMTLNYELTRTVNRYDRWFEDSGRRSLVLHLTDDTVKPCNRELREGLYELSVEIIKPDNSYEWAEITLNDR